MSAVPKIDTPLWPNLGLVWHGPLDHAVVQVDRDWLLHAAGQVEISMRGPLRYSVVELLKHLAGKPMAIKDLNAGPNHQTAPQKVRGLNVVVHYLAAKELAIKSPARQYVATTWNIEDTSVKSLNRSYAKAAHAELEKLIELWPALERVEVLRRIDADMSVRARLSWLRF